MGLARDIRDQHGFLCRDSSMVSTLPVISANCAITSRRNPACQEAIKVSPPPPGWQLRRKSGTCQFLHSPAPPVIQKPVQGISLLLLQLLHHLGLDHWVQGVRIFRQREGPNDRVADHENHAHVWWQPQVFLRDEMLPHRLPYSWPLWPNPPRIGVFGVDDDIAISGM